MRSAGWHPSQRLAALLSLRPELSGFELTPHRRDPLAHDRLLLGRSDAGLVVIGVEPMPDEALGAPPPRVGRLVRQLQAALAGTLADALSRRATYAVLLIHELSSGGRDVRSEVADGLAVELFLQRLAPDDLGRCGSPEAWITEPFAAREEGSAPDSEPLRVFVAKLVSRA